MIPLKKQIESLDNALEAEKQRTLRVLADLENLRRRENENKRLWSAAAVADYLRSVAPSLAELRTGQQHTQDGELSKVIDKFFAAQEKSGLKKIEPQAGDAVDPAAHEVLLTEEGEPGKVARTLEVGWKFGETVIVPARVSAASL